MTLRGRRFRALLSRLFLLPHIVCCGALCGVCECANSARFRAVSVERARAPAWRARAFPSRGESPRCAVTRGRVACLTTVRHPDSTGLNLNVHPRRWVPGPWTTVRDGSAAAACGTLSTELDGSLS